MVRLLKAIKEWRAEAKRLKAAKRQKANAEYYAEMDYLRNNGICLGCKGRKRVDIPPWGILECEECGGTGRVVHLA